MPVTLSTAQANLLLSQVGRKADAELLELLPIIAEQYQDKVSKNPRSLFLHVKKDVLDLLLGGQWESVDHKEGDESSDDADRFENLSKMRKDVIADIATLETNTVSASGPVAGQLTTQTTVAAPACSPDPSDRLYAGDPLRRHPVPGNEWR
ncbi:MAG: hypothetical protein V4671_02285 [Armatimonadota bacterium]